MVTKSTSAAKQLLIVDDDAAICRLASAMLQRAGYEVTTASSGEAALKCLENASLDLVLTDVRMPGISGIELLSQIRQSDPELPIIIMTAFGSVESAVEAMRAGANDYVMKPLEEADLEHRVRQALRLRVLEAENRWLHKELASSYGPHRIVAVSREMRRVVETIERLAPMKHTVLITGESGTGKELLARALHFGTPRSSGPFVAVNCAALPSELVESELFGSARGAFTGALKDRAGKIEAAHGGTLFLDEVAELPREVQPKLLRVLETHCVERVGENKLREVDLRLVAATNKDPEALVKKGEFREDLYYRLAVVPVAVPPLRSRPEDIGPLARYLVERIGGDEAPELTDDAIEALSAQPWPGNVRELANLLERTLALHEGGPITSEVLFGGSQPAGIAPVSEPGASPRVTLPAEGAALDDMVRDLVVQALERQRWNQSAAARLLKIPRHVLQYRMEKYGIVPPGG